VLDEIRLPITGNADIDNQLQAAYFFGHVSGEHEFKNCRGLGTPFDFCEVPLLALAWSVGRKWAAHGDVGLALDDLSRKLEELGYPQETEERKADTVLRVVK
jgi:hypothetical protein